MRAKTAQKILSFSILVLASLLIYFPCNFFLSQGYKACINSLFLNDLPETRDLFLKSVYGEHLYEGLKAIPVLIFIYMGLIWIDFFRSQKRKGTIWIVRISNGFIDSFYQNKVFILKLGKPAAVTLLCLLLIQLIANVYFLNNLPLGYDEWWSYSHFSGRGFWYSLSRYPLPNNHVLYNIIASLFLSLPIEVEYAVRIQSILATLISTYLLFKILKYCFGNTLSFILLVFVITNFPFAMYGFQARGYSFVCLCTVVLIYSTLKLLENYSLKYRILLIISLLAGHLSIPTFLYSAFAILLVFALQLFFQKRFSDLFSLVKDSIMSGLLVVVSYSFILFFNDQKNLLNPNGGATKFSLSEAGSFDKIKEHYSIIGNYLSGFDNALLWIALLALIILFINKKKVNNASGYLIRLSVFMLFSPLLIILIHRVLPFERTWLYLIFPLSICIGFILKSLQDFFQAEKLNRVLHHSRNYVFIVTCLFCVTLFFKFDYGYHRVTLEFEEKQLGEASLKPVLGSVSKIAFTEIGQEFHIAHVLSSMCFKTSKNVFIYDEKLTAVQDQDILIIHVTKLSQFSPALKPYTLVKLISANYLIFVKTALL